MTAEARRAARSPAAGGGGSSLGGVIGVLVVIAGILYAGVLVAGRTEGFRSLVAERLSKAAGMQMTVGGSKVTTGLALVLYDVRAADLVAGRPAETPKTDAARPEVSVGEATIEFDLLRQSVRAVEAGDVRIVIVRDAGGGWQPERFSGWAAWAEEGMGLLSPASLSSGPAETPSPGSETARSPLMERAVPRIRIRSADLEWRGHDGAVLAGWKGVQAEVTPFETSRRRMLHVGISAREGHRASGWSFRGARVEWIESADQRWPLAVSLGGEETDDPEP